MNMRPKIRALAVATMIVGSAIAQGAMAQDVSEGADPNHSKRILIYSDSNAWGWVPTEDGFPTVRLPDQRRFGGMLDAALGDEFDVVVDGLNNRTTNLDDPQDWSNVPGRAFNGAAELPEVIASELPLDLVVVMLGTNDAKAQFDRTAEEIAAAAIGVAEIAAESTGVATAYEPPRVLVVAPPPIGVMNHEGIAQFFAGADAKSARFAEAFRAAGEEAGVPVFVAADAMGSSDGYDGVHFTPEDHRQLGEGLAPVVRAMLE